jgi:hypothetical protein
LSQSSWVRCWSRSCKKTDSWPACTIFATKKQVCVLLDLCLSGWWAFFFLVKIKSVNETHFDLLLGFFLFLEKNIWDGRFRFSWKSAVLFLSSRLYSFLFLASATFFLLDQVTV